MNVELFLYEVSVFNKNDIFNVFDSSTKSDASANVVAVKQQRRVQCEINNSTMKVIQIIWKQLI